MKRNFIITSAFIIFCIVFGLFANQCLFAESVSNERWSFVVFGDTRDLSKDTKTGISPFLSKLAERIAAEKPALVIHTGDLVNGYYTHASSPVHGKYDEMFENWKRAVKPIYDFNRRMGIPLYTVRGNHEDGELITNDTLKRSYLKNIAAFMPQNGPQQEKGLSFTVSHRQATFFALDEYSIKEFGVLRGLVDQPWLDEELVKRKVRFMFAFGHAPAYKVAISKKGPFPDLYYFVKHRDRFWESLRDAGVSMYFCGHVHFYSRVTKNAVQQVLVGNGGANTVAYDPNEVDPAVELNYPIKPMQASEVKPGYLLITVDEVKGTLSAVQKLWNENTNAWEIGDKFTIKVK